MNRLAHFVFAGLLFVQPVAAQTHITDADVIARLDRSVDTRELAGWMKSLAAEPNNVGSPHDKSNAEWVLQRYRNWGLDAHMETFQVLYPTPVDEALEMKGWKATLQEPPISGDTSAISKQPALPAYVEYQGDGDVTAPLVYVNYGNLDDFRQLEQQGVSVKGKIVIVRYGKGWRGLKPLLAQMHGAIGTVIYSDPAEDGYSIDAVLPKGAGRPPVGIQRGSVADQSFFTGDPLTPGVGASQNAKRITRQASPAILKIPVLPISYADAQVLLAAMDGQVAPDAWRGHLPITYRIDSTVPVHLLVKSDWSLKTIYDVIGIIKGADYPDEWVIRGNHRDGWVFGATDPLSGQVAMLEEAKALGLLAKAGWKPKRTIIYASWDGEEPGMLGSTEWAELHADELREKGVLYLNTDEASRGLLRVGGTGGLEKFVDQATGDLRDPETGASVTARRRAKQALDAGSARADGQDMAIDPIGGGSDFAAFVNFIGMPALDITYAGEGDHRGFYHSRYDTFENHNKFVDPGFIYGALQARTLGRLVIRAAGTDRPLQNGQDFATAISQYVSELKTLTSHMRQDAQVQRRLLADDAYRLAADPTRPRADPAPLAAVPDIDFGPLDRAAAKLGKSAKAFDAAVAGNSSPLKPAVSTQLRAIAHKLDQSLILDEGLPGRGNWYKNLVYAPGRFTGYGSKTIPGVRESLEDRRWPDAVKYIGLTAAALDAYSARLDQAAELLQSH